MEGLTDAAFVELFRNVIPTAVSAYSPQAVVFQCGVDTLARDPVGTFNLTSGGICDAVRLLRDLKLPLLVLGGGGYHPRYTFKLVMTNSSRHNALNGII